MEHIINPVYYQDFILSGKPEFTLRSTLTGNEEIFVVKKGLVDKLYWVNNRLRQFIGQIHLLHGASEDVWVFDQKTQDILLGQADQIKIFSWFWNAMILRPHEIRPYDRIKVINHSGRCGHCHRELTHPESIPIGIGPDCFKKLGLTYKTLITS
jgi:uncharacterized CHY-type Zn-finger protein